MNEVEFVSPIDNALKQMYVTVVNYPSIVEILIEEFAELLDSTEPPDYLKPNNRTPLNKIFSVSMGKSIGKDNYPLGSVPYISSGETFNGVIGLVNAPLGEIYDSPCITVTAFGRWNLFSLCQFRNYFGMPVR
jgi:hypothetical protein